MFWAEIDGLEELERALTQGDQAVSDGCREAVASAVSEGAAEAKSTHRYQDRTHALTDSIAGVVDISTPGGAVGTIKATAPYASFVDGGTNPHDIHAKAGAANVGPLPKGQSRSKTKSHINGGTGLLKFMIGGRWVSKAMVHHPGTSPDGFMGTAYHKAEDVLLRVVEVAVAKAKAIVER